MLKKSLTSAAIVAATVVSSASPAFAGPPITPPAPVCTTYLSTNAARGDVVLTRSGGILRDLMNSLGQSFTHVGVAASASNVIQNTLDTNQIDTVGGLIPSALNSVGYKSVREGYPGTQNISWASAFTRDFNRWDSLVLSGPAHMATQRSNVANQMGTFNGHYRLYAFTDMTWKNPTVRAGDDGNMCSGTILYAQERAGLIGANYRVNYTAEVRNRAIAVLREAVRKEVYAAGSGNSGAFKFQAFFGGTNLTWFAEHGANQVANCVAFNDCGNQSFRWAGGVGQGNTVSPTDLYNLVATFKGLASWLGVANPYPYQDEKPLTNRNVTCCSYPGFGNIPPSYSCN